MKVVMLLSGGLDSKILLAWAKEKYDVIAVTIDYGKHTEVERAINHAKEYNTEHYVVKISPFFWSDKESKTEVPLRNLVFLSEAITIAKTKGAEKILYATHYPPDYDKGYYYQDCSPEFVKNLNLFTQTYGITIETPFLYYTLEREIKEGIRLGVNFEDVHICNFKEEINCGECMKCQYTLRTLSELWSPTSPKFETTKAMSQSNPDYLWLNEARLYINNRCNRMCDFCFYGYGDSGTKELDWHDWVRALDKLKEVGIKLLMFSGKEPLIDNKIFKIVAYANSLGFKCDINTNGDNIAKYFRTIKRMNFNRILVSYHEGWNVHLILRLNGKVQPYLVITKENKMDMLKTIDYLYKNGVKKYYIRFAYPTPQFKDVLNVEEQEDYLRRIWDMKMDAIIETPIDFCMVHTGTIYKNAINDYHQRGYVQYKFDGTTQRFLIHTLCHQYWKTITILHDGTIVGCAKQTYLPYKDLKKKSIGSIQYFDAQDIIDECKNKIRQGNAMCLRRG